MAIVGERPSVIHLVRLRAQELLLLLQSHAPCHLQSPICSTSWPGPNQNQRERSSSSAAYIFLPRQFSFAPVILSARFLSDFFAPDSIIIRARSFSRQVFRARFSRKYKMFYAPDLFRARLFTRQTSFYAPGLRARIPRKTFTLD